MREEGNVCERAARVYGPECEGDLAGNIHDTETVVRRVAIVHQLGLCIA